LILLLLAGILMLAMGITPVAWNTDAPTGQMPIAPESPNAPNYYTGERRISNPTSPETTRYYPSVAYNPGKEEYLVVWYNWWSSTFQDIYARRVAANGQLKSWFCVATGAGGDNKIRMYPAAAYNHWLQEYLVVYMYDASGDGVHWEVWGRRVAWDGSYLGAEFQIMAWPNRAFWTPRVVYSNQYGRNEYLVIANAYDTQNGRWNDVTRRRVLGSGGTPYPVGAVIQDPVVQPHQADLAYNVNADEYLVVWRQRWAGDDWDIHGARLSADNGSVLGSPFVVDASAVDQSYPAVTTDNWDRYLVVWQHGVGMPTTGWDIYGRELDRNGAWVGSLIPIATSSDLEYYPDAEINLHTDRRYVIWQRVTAGRYEVWQFDWDPTPPAPMVWPFRIASDVAWTPPVLVGMGAPSFLVVYGRNEPVGLHIYGRTWLPHTVFLPLVVRSW